MGLHRVFDGGTVVADGGGCAFEHRGELPFGVVGRLDDRDFHSDDIIAGGAFDGDIALAEDEVHGRRDDTAWGISGERHIAIDERGQSATVFRERPSDEWFVLRESGKDVDVSSFVDFDDCFKFFCFHISVILINILTDFSHNDSGFAVESSDVQTESFSLFFHFVLVILQSVSYLKDFAFMVG